MQMQMNIEDQPKELKNKARFISCVVSGEIKITMRSHAALLQVIIAKGFDRLPREGQTIVYVNGDIERNHDAIDYAYLTSIPICCLNKEYLRILVEKTKRIEA
jgi:hypothetical protein